MKTNKPILLLEDDRVDSESFRRAMIKAGITNPLQVAENGEDGISYLNDKNKAKPCLIVLDLNLPRMNGFEFLDLLKKNDVFRKIPVVVLTTSKAESDKEETFKRGIAGYMVKPMDQTKLTEMVEILDRYWSLSELPSI